MHQISKLACKRQIKVVVIDDDREDFLLIKGLLGDVELNLYQTDWVADFSEAIAVIKKQEADVYLVDFNLGEKTGLDILKELRGLPLSRPMILLTGMDDRAIDLSAMEEGAADFLKKTHLSAEILERSIRYSIRSANDLVRLKAAEKIKIEKEAAEIANQAKSRFLAHMSHEIRTPLTAILGFVELAKDPIHSAEERLEFLNIVEKSGDHLLRVINDILDLSKIEEGGLETVPSPFDVRASIRDALKLMAPAAKSKGIRLAFMISGKAPETINTDVHVFRQILLNMLGNAIKFTKHGEVIVELRGSSDESGFAVSVRDTGIGIAVEEQERLFRPFSQANSSLNRKFGGTGLGLDLSRKLAHRLGGDVLLAQSAVGVGSTFVLTLPLQPGGIALESKRVNTDLARLPFDLSAKNKLRVLVADDSKDNQLLMRHFFKGTGIEASFVSNGAEAIVEAGYHEFDVILMDIQMPEMDGYEATNMLRSKGYKNPIIALTAHSFKEEQEKALSSGFNDFVSKPFSRDRLLSVLNSMAVIQD